MNLFADAFEGHQKPVFMAGEPSHAATWPKKRTGHAPVLISGKKIFFCSQAIFLWRCLGDFWPKCHFFAFLGWFDDVYEPFIRLRCCFF